MKKHFFLNLLLNLGIIFLIFSGISAYQSGHTLFLGLSIAVLVVLLYLKVVLLKHVRASISQKQQHKAQATKQPIKGKKKNV